MRVARRRVLLSTALVGLAVTAAADPDAVLDPARDAVPRSAQEILDCGFEKRFDRELAQIIDVETSKDGRKVRSFRLQMASKSVDGRYRSLVYFLAPYDERGIVVLTIENETRSDEHFVFLPFLERVKRIYGGRRQESFMGTDFTYEDMERVRVDELDAELRPREELEGEPVHVVSTRPRYVSSYVRSEYRVAVSDCNILEIRHFKNGREAPAKIVSIPRASMRRIAGEPMPTEAVARDLEAGRLTRLRFSETTLDPGLADRYFEPSALLRLSGIPGLSRKGAPSP